ncbi:MAG: succinate dehydrogenase iron-sulfur subunit [Gammaproteobacteria bacterium]
MNQLTTNRIEFVISRFNPETDKKPYLQSYWLDIPTDSDMMLLTALLRIKNEQDESLAFRRSCAEGVCGSDGMNINGQNGLACITPVSKLGQRIVLRPLPGMPIIRDLIIDMTLFYKQNERVKPWLQNSQPEPATERLQSPEDRAKLDGLYECILCACCTTSCPSFWWNHGKGDKFIGPAGLLALNRWVEDSRDDATAERLAELGDPDSLFACHSIMNCVKACPKELNPTKAIGNLRKKMLSEATKD